MDENSVTWTNVHGYYGDSDHIVGATGRSFVIFTDVSSSGMVTVFVITDSYNHYACWIFLCRMFRLYVELASGM
jgi:hypothetical protein